MGRKKVNVQKARFLGDILLKEIAEKQLTGITRRQLVVGKGVEYGNQIGRAKRLGRMIRDGYIQEPLLLNGESNRINLKCYGFVAVKVSLAGLREAKKKGLPHDHESVIESIVTATHTWAQENDEDDDGIVPPLILLDAYIVLLGDFDILLSLMYRNERVLMRYIEQVVHSTENVQNTRAIVIAYRRGVQNLRGHINQPVTRRKTLPRGDSPATTSSFSSLPCIRFSHRPASGVESLQIACLCYPNVIYREEIR